MAYVLVRLYSGKSHRTADEILETVEKELAPRLLKAGCRRYTTLKLRDGRIGSTSAYDNRVSFNRISDTLAAARQAGDIAAEYVRGTNVMHGWSLSRILAGDVVFAWRGAETLLDGSCGAMWRLQTAAPSHEITEALNLEIKPLLQQADGLRRFTAVQQPDGFIALTAHDTHDAARRLNERARQAFAKNGTRLFQLCPRPPDIIEGEVRRSYSG
jgi:hypothetical protein